MHIHQIEEAAAANATADRFDGFDRGDLDRDHEADDNARNEAELDEMKAAALFVSVSGERYWRVKRHTTQVRKSEEIDFGVRDAKGRAVGMWRRWDFVSFEFRTDDSGGELLKEGSHLNRFEGYAQATRDGKSFGGSWIHILGESEEALVAELEKRIEQARRLAVKKFGSQA